MEIIYIIGAGGFGREILWLIDRINDIEPVWQVKGFIDDGVDIGTDINGIKVVGGIDYLNEVTDYTNVVCAIGAAATRKKVVKKIAENDKLQFPTLIDPLVHASSYIDYGRGNIICAGSILTTNIEMGEFNIVNLSCTIGHDVKIGSYNTVFPGVSISGNVKIDNSVEIGTGTKIIQGKTIVSDIIIGAGAVVVSDLFESGTYVGCPARKIK